MTRIYAGKKRLLARGCEQIVWEEGAGKKTNLAILLRRESHEIHFNATILPPSRTGRRGAIRLRGARIYGRVDLPWKKCLCHRSPAHPIPSSPPSRLQLATTWYQRTDRGSNNGGGGGGGPPKPDKAAIFRLCRRRTLQFPRLAANKNNVHPNLELLLRKNQKGFCTRNSMTHVQ